MKRSLSIIMVLILMIGVVPTYAAEGDIVDIASNAGVFTTLVAALDQAELVSALQGEGPFTVFAPTDEAFGKLLAQLDISASDLLNHPQLAEVLLYHVVPAKVMSTDLVDGMYADTLLGESVMIDLSNGVKINSSNVSSADIEATNGVIHIIDDVLVPQSFVLNPMMEEPTMDVVDIALGNEDFSMLVSLLQKADLVTALQGEGPFTVFAPTNEAFENLLMALNISAADLMAQPDLANVLLYHVVPAKVMSTDLSDGMMAGTLLGESISVDLSNGVMINSSNVITADIDASNGVVHVIDQVLVPAGFTLEMVDMTEELPKTGEIMFPVGLFGFIGLAGLFITRKK